MLASENSFKMNMDCSYNKQIRNDNHF